MTQEALAAVEPERWWQDDRQYEARPLASFELAAKFVAAENDSPGRARRMLIAALRRSGYGDRLVQDAALVVTELAANAVLHAGSSFSVSVSLEAATLRIAVDDKNPIMGPGSVPRPEHGLGLIEAVSADWGTAATSGGKVVWAELRV
jgi:hypothetical protein